MSIFKIYENPDILYTICTFFFFSLKSEHTNMLSGQNVNVPRQLHISLTILFDHYRKLIFDFMGKLEKQKCYSFHWIFPTLRIFHHIEN